MSALRNGIQRVSDEAGGLLELQVVQHAYLPALIGDALGGSTEALQLLRLVNDVAGSIQSAPRRKPMLCGSCPRGLHGAAFSVIVARPACDNPSEGLALAICPKCGPTHDAIQAAATVALGRIWPNIWPVTVTHSSGGRA